MLGKKRYEPKMLYNFTIEQLIPEDNIYRLLDKFLDMRFLYKECENLYGNTGKPSIDPVVFFKLQIFGYLENIISDRDLVRKAGDSISARYFLGYDIDESLPWHSTISRTRGLMGKEKYEKLFNKVIEICNQSGLIGGKHQTIDSTLVKANASMESLERKQPKMSASDYAEKTFEENKDKEEEDKEDKEEEDKENKGGNKRGGRRENDKYESRTDPDSRIAQKPGTPTNLYYKAQYCADSKNRVITDVLVTGGDIDDKYSLIDVIKRAGNRLEKFNLRIELISADRGYSSGKVLRELEQMGIEAFIPSQKKGNPNGEINKEEFIYNKEKDLFICPDGKELRHYDYDRQKESDRYKAKQRDCSKCLLKERCCPGSKLRTVYQNIYHEEYQRTASRLRTPMGRRILTIRQIISEGLFAEAKNSHGLRKFMTRGLDKAQKRAYMIACVQNLKRLVKGYRKYPQVLDTLRQNILFSVFNLKKINYISFS